MKKEYSFKDSLYIYLLVLLLPIIITFIVYAIISNFSLNIVAQNYILLVVSQLSFLGIFLIYSKIKKVDIKSASIFNFKLNFWLILIVLVIGLIAMYSFSPLVNYIDYLLSLVGYNTEPPNVFSMSNFGMFLITVLVVAVMPAICEECVFRGAITSGLSKYKKWIIIVLSGLMFALFHMNVQQLIYQFVLGMALASVMLTTGSIVYTMLLHFFNNFVVLFTNYIAPTSSDTIVPTTVMDHILPFVLAVAGSIVIYFLLKYLKIVKKQIDRKNEQKLQKNERNTENIDKNTENLTSNSKSELVVDIKDNEKNDVLSEQNEKLSFGKLLTPLFLITMFITLLLWIVTFIISFTGE